MRNQGFTLTELMVVLAVMGLIAAMLLPVLASARRQAHGTSCVSNLRQLGLVTMCYLEDHDRVVAWYIPVVEAYEMQPGKYINLPIAAHKVLLPNLRDDRLLRCPLDIGAQFTADTIEQATVPVWERYGTSYITGLDSYRLDSLPPYEAVLWTDHVGYWHHPHRGVLDYRKGWQDSRTNWRHNAVTTTYRLVKLNSWQVQGAIWGYNVFDPAFLQEWAR